ncbi:hypothetical protein [Psychroserpens ponticola]|uniref:Uncharacterized protein n=1 Tax=Psychroserpens ponticola TaxID=2932268 RepID=A0ABY7RU17_9FLAO|nr:hypothetical protein [Psychroserpens ponticola]WCO00597.1 hypothetical protein MUN68_011025 [Psychroserpens ponticola]
MKNIICLFCISFLLISCGGNDDSSDDGQMLDDSDYYISFTESGNNYDSRASQNTGVSVASVLIESPNSLAFSVITDFVTNNGKIIVLLIELTSDAPVGFGAGFELNGGNEDYILESIYSRASLSGGNSFGGSADENNEIYLKIISLDRDNKIISGKFSFTAVSDDESESKTVSNGYFNVNYQ